MSATHTIPTGLPIDVAVKVIEKAMAAYQERFAKYKPHFSWKNPTLGVFGFVAKGFSVDGKLTLRDGSIDVALDVPFLLRPFRGKAISVVEEEVNVWVVKAKNGEIA